jgi:hypothetical protein
MNNHRILSPNGQIILLFELTGREERQEESGNFTD